MRRAAVVGFALMAAGCLGAAPPPPDWHVIAGRVPLDWQGPDGNSIVLDAPEGLIVFDTGRSPLHAQKLLEFAKARNRPVAAILNSHWHLDHTTGNYDLRQAFPAAQVYATAAIEGALAGFLNRSRAEQDKAIADPKTPPGQRAQMIRGRYRVDHPDTLRATRLVTGSETVSVAGRTLQLHVAPFAASEADLWVYDPKARLVLVGDLVVDVVPFMDTACVEGWKKALAAVEAVPFQTLVPGHGPVMNRTDFTAWKRAFDNFVECGRSAAVKEQCIDGWSRDAARFIDSDHAGYAKEGAAYYLETRLRSSPAEQQKYCRPLTAG